MCAITLIIITSNVKTAHLPLGILMGKMPLVGTCLSLHQCLYIDWAMGVSFVYDPQYKLCALLSYTWYAPQTDGVKLFDFFCKKRFSCLCFYCRSWCLYRVADVLNITVFNENKGNWQAPYKCCCDALWKPRHVCSFHFSV